MIDAAERLIAEFGISAMTLKDVQIEAGQLNKSAAKYHFGSRDGLIQAVLEDRMSRVNERREEMLDELDALGHLPTVRQIVETLVLPFAVETLGSKGSRYARFLSQVMYGPVLSLVAQEQLSAEAFRRVEALVVGVVNAPLEVVKRRVRNIIHLNIVVLARWEQQERSQEKSADIVCDLIGTCAAVLEAPVSENDRYSTMLFGADDRADD
ncbi:TetR/AcrR family transcriptional regulator [Rhodococcus sp. ARC_M6]|uniref:TetR/AcrR family transcriptional regulator n=1 Tax=Rhodococcus sp. ARC_M6 TaxID=2928852 RepID=UPI001FB473B9|nr:helix-turn-helix domain-containing protein [Rhodococcus sp. ARC_M6]MCJ0907272.1 TetR/AcrR family transcriptional regulator [Rhodococcus sp. ARC_M6]